MVETDQFKLGKLVGKLEEEKKNRLKLTSICLGNIILVVIGEGIGYISQLPTSDDTILLTMIPTTLSFGLGIKNIMQSAEISRKIIDLVNEKPKRHELTDDGELSEDFQENLHLNNHR